MTYCKYSFSRTPVIIALSFKIKNEFLSKLDQDVKNINKSESIFVPANNTTNFYKLGRDEYNKLLRDNTTAKYKRTNDSHTNRINKEAKHIAEKLHFNCEMKLGVTSPLSHSECDI